MTTVEGPARSVQLSVKYYSSFQYVRLLLNVPLVLLPEPVKAQVSAESPKDVFGALTQV